MNCVLMLQAKKMGDTLTVGVISDGRLNCEWHTTVYLAKIVKRLLKKP